MSFAPEPLRPRILIVEDSYLTADAIGDVVRDCGYEVAGATASIVDGPQAVEKERLDGTVLDIDLAGRQYWRERAEDARARAAEMGDQDAERIMLNIARMYDEVGDRAARREAKAKPAD